MLVFMFRVDGPKVILAAISSANIGQVGLAAGCMMLYWVLEAVVLFNVCHAINCKIRFTDCFATSMIGQLFNCLTPFASGGQPIQAYKMVKCGVPLGQASCALLTKFIIYQFMLTLYTLAVILMRLKFFLREISGFTLIVLIGFGANSVVMLLILGISFFPKATTRFLFWVVQILHRMKIVKNLDSVNERIVTEAKQFYDNVAVIKSKVHRFILPCILTAVQLTAFFTVPYFVCLSLDAVGVSYITVVCAAAFVLLISSFVPLPGGSGGAEGGFYLFFGMFFEQSSMISVAIILWRLMTFYLPILAGIVFSRPMISKTKRISENSQGVVTTNEDKG